MYPRQSITVLFKVIREAGPFRSPYEFDAPMISFAPSCNRAYGATEVSAYLAMPAVDRTDWDKTQTSSNSVVFLQPCAQLQWSGSILEPQDYAISKTAGVESIPFNLLNPERDTSPWEENPRLQSVEL